VRGTNILSRQHRPFAQIPVFGKLSEYSWQSPNKDAWDVFNECEAGSHLAKHSPEGGPKITLVGLASSLSGHAPGLAGDAAKHEVNETSPRASIEIKQVRPEGSIINEPVSHSDLQQPLAVSILLHIADSSSAEGSPDGTADS